MTPMEVYKLLYRVYKTMWIKLSLNEDASSRMANKLAVKFTWEAFNNQSSLDDWVDLDIKFRKEGYYD